MHIHPVKNAMLRALTTKIGAVFYTSDPDAYRRHFYQIRNNERKLGNLDFDCLSVVTPPYDQENHIWIVKKEKTNAEASRSGPREGNSASIPGG